MSIQRTFRLLIVFSMSANYFIWVQCTRSFLAHTVGGATYARLVLYIGGIGPRVSYIIFKSICLFEPVLIKISYVLHLINTNNVYYNSLYCRSKIVKITDLLVSTFARNRGNCNLIGRYDCMVTYMYLCTNLYLYKF